MATKYGNTTQCGSINRKWSQEDRALWDSLLNIATKAAEAGDDDESDWSAVYAAATETFLLVHKQREVAAA